MADTTLESIVWVPDAVFAKVAVLSDALADMNWTDWLLVAMALYFVYSMLRWQWRIDHFQNRYILVTGCDTGLGFRLVQRLDKLGFPVFAGCLTSEGVERVAKVTSRRVMPLSLNVTNQDNIREVVDSITSTMPPGHGLWAVVNNAGVMPSMAPFELTSRESFERSWAVNLKGTVDVTRACLPLVRRSRGRIINTSSISGLVGFVAADYTISKFAVEGFTACLRREMAKQGIHVSTMNPGGFRSSLCNIDMYHAEIERLMDTLPAEVQQYFGGKEYILKRKQLLAHFQHYIRWGSSALDKVADAYVHALSARFPYTRYVVGYDANFLFRPLWCMPDWATDFVLWCLPLYYLH